MNLWGRRTIILTTLVVHQAYIAKVQGLLPCNKTDVLLYHCQNGECISRRKFCDETNDCSDGSDEFTDIEKMNGTAGCQFRVRTPLVDKMCILPARYLCDHEIDCVGGKDECGCDSTFECEKEGDCALKTSFCDSFPVKYGCLDGSDEYEFNRTTRKGFQCPVTKKHNTKVCSLPDKYVCDGDSDCDFGTDECFCNFTDGIKKGSPMTDLYFDENCFRCFDGSLVIPSIHVCDGIVHCMDLSDECACPEGRAVERPGICDYICRGSDCSCPGKVRCHPRTDLPSVNTTTNVPATNEIECLQHSSICDNTYDCQDRIRIDEQFCPASTLHFQCRDGSRKIMNFLVCNGPHDCPDGSDELFCHEERNYFCRNQRRRLKNITDWENLTISEISLQENMIIFPFIPFFAIKCDGVPSCKELDDECRGTCDNEPEFCNNTDETAFKCSVSGSRIMGLEVCDGKPNCNDTVPEISEDELGCPNRFYCENKGKTRLPIHIPKESRCNRKVECDDKSDELNCSEKTHFYCNDSGSTLFVSHLQVCDDKKDCKEGLDECQNCTNSPFSSAEKLIRSRVLIVFLWITGIFAVIGNSTTFIQQIWKIVRPGRTVAMAAANNRVLVLNLCTADLLVGIYLISLGIKDATVNKYCVLDQEWRSSAVCSTLGAIALIGTEASVFILLIMTGCRLHVVMDPLKRQRRRHVVLAIIVAWMLAFTIALLPFAPSLRDYFVSCVWFKNHPFFGKICRNELQKFTKELVLLDGYNNNFIREVRDGYTWDNMFSAMTKLNPDYVPERYFGYYSAHSVCLPRLFPDPEVDEAWGYSMFLIVINFLAFVFILASYSYIYRKSTNITVRKFQTVDRAGALQRKVTRIVLTDFLCWMPICIMAFLKLGGFNLSPVTYAVTAIILLPINSAMNPFMYSDILDIVWAKMLPIKIWCNATPCGRLLEKASSKKVVQRRNTETITAETEIAHVTLRAANFIQRQNEDTTI